MEHIARFLPNRPIGKDLYDGQSQDRIADAIMKHILDVDAIDDNNRTLPRIIGIEGVWGSGKSNTLLQLDKKLGDCYYFFTYDAWGNQEDLQRRSLLELLTKELVVKEMLVKDTKIKVISNAIDVKPKEEKCNWETRLFTLLARTSATHNVTIPTFRESTKYFILMLAVSAIWVALINAVKSSTPPCWFYPVAFVLGFVPFFVFCAKMWKEKWSWKEMWDFYQTTGKQDTSSYTISELEPSVSEFREWMNDLSDSLDTNQKLVIVFDNMDRLPKEKVRQLWSSIQTFFADKGYPKVWCIIPFDREHLANAFNEAGEIDKKMELTNYFIEKTFPVVYRIPEPIITDYKAVFEKLFIQAFEEREEQELINRCYRLANGKPNIREIISFINKLVALTHEWGDRIKLTSMALFLLNQDDILKNTEENIINRNYLSGFPGMFEESEDLDTEISSLAYGVEKKDAVQLPMKNLIKQALNKGDKTPFADYAQQSSHFFVILKEEIYEMDEALLDNAINQVSVLNFEGLFADDSGNLHMIWTKLAKLYLMTKEKETTFRKEVKALLDNCEQLKQEIGNHFLSNFTDKDNTHTGAEWYKVYRDVAVYSMEKGLKLVLPEQEMKNVDFVEFLKTAKEDYKNYPVKCANDQMNQYCLGQITNNLDVMDIVKLLKGDKQYEFSELMKSAREMIENHHDVNSSNFDHVINVLKYLSIEPLKLKLDKSFLNNLQYEGPMLADYRVLMMLAGNEVSNLTENDFEAMAKVVFEYDTMDTIWNKCQTVGTNVFIGMTRYLILYGVHDNKPASTKNIITEMVRVKTQTGLSEKAVIKYLNDWGRRGLTPEEEILDFATELKQETWIAAFEEDKHEFAKAVLGKYYKDCGTKEWSLFINNSNIWQTANYWPKMLCHLALDPDFWRTKPRNIKSIVEHLIAGICSENIIASNIDQNMLDNILANLVFSDVSTTVHNELAKFSSTYHINEFKFMKLHCYFEQTKGQEPLFLNKVLKPVVSLPSVQNVVLSNLNYYEPLLQHNIDQASDLKAELIKLYTSSQNEELRALIERLNIIDMKENETGVSAEN